MNWLKTLLASQGFHSFYHAVLAGAVGYVASNPVANTHAWISGLVTAVVGAWVGWYNGSPAGTNPAVTPLVKMVAFFVLFSMLTSSASAGYLISPPKEKLGLPLPTGTAFYLMPIEGFDVGKSLSLPNPTYGLSVNEDLVYAVQTTVNGIPNLAPILGLGASLYLDISGPFSNGPLYLCLGLNALGPDLDLFGMGNGQGLVPQVLFIHNFVTNEDKLTGGLTVFTDLGPGTAQKL